MTPNKYKMAINQITYYCPCLTIASSHNFFMTLTINTAPDMKIHKLQDDRFSKKDLSKF